METPNPQGISHRDLEVLREVLDEQRETIEALKDKNRKLAYLLKEADDHIRNQLQAQFQRLARGLDVEGPEGFSDEQKLMRLATWWHGAGVDDAIKHTGV